jgi:hypothetical protein
MRLVAAGLIVLGDIVSLVADAAVTSRSEQRRRGKD